MKCERQAERPARHDGTAPSLCESRAAARLRLIPASHQLRSGNAEEKAHCDSCYPQVAELPAHPTKSGRPGRAARPFPDGQLQFQT